MFHPVVKDRSANINVTSMLVFIQMKPFNSDLKLNVPEIHAYIISTSYNIPYRRGMQNLWCDKRQFHNFTTNNNDAQTRVRSDIQWNTLPHFGTLHSKGSESSHSAGQKLQWLSIVFIVAVLVIIYTVYDDYCQHECILTICSAIYSHGIMYFN